MKNMPPALSTDSGCSDCYRGRIMVDIASGQPLKPDERTYGAVWQVCPKCVKCRGINFAIGHAPLNCALLIGHTGDHWDGAGATWPQAPDAAQPVQAQPTSLGICTDVVQLPAEAPAKSHPIRGEVVSMMVDANPDLGQYDPVMVFLVDHGEGRGSITLACYNMAWTGYFGAMGSTFKPATIREFVKRASLGYLNTKLRGECNRRDKRTEQYLDRVLLTVQAAL